jgi:hypothetical protein
MSARRHRPAPPPKPKVRTISLAVALEALRRPDHLLVVLHGKSKPEWFVMPGGPVTEPTARRILERPDVQPHDTGLLPGHPQSWRLRARG